jgi:hypothetical protein
MHAQLHASSRVCLPDATFMAWTGGATWLISVYLIALALITFVATMAAPDR